MRVHEYHATHTRGAKEGMTAVKAACGEMWVAAAGSVCVQARYGLCGVQG